MGKISLVLCTLLPLAWSSAALAAPPNAPEGPAPAGGADRHHGDFAAWHKEMCTEHFARMAEHLGYLQARLELSDQQAPAFDKWRQAVLEQGAKERSSCLEATPKADAKPGLPEREARLEKILSLQLQGLQATRPALEGFYDTLSAEQKSLFDREFLPHGGHHGPMGGHGEPMGGPMDGPMTMEHGQK
ncbi:Spy/CpxP family protein refolding chaperone [Telmatospirillum siberiense]|uniref:LTXXQ motif family protein n=1 Tax=Telmatospirillum siberiense TaxID=382514 RepID=A0A2N3PT49_9PROT|nr:Spy/CpxP family protein refolding chaperone [Telmatospirillum siberiense]PKU23546.1 hypothetical protein CWS72_15880 [Telmatospirillum siberiense]